METNNFLLKTNNGKKSFLDKAYCKHINTIFEKIDEDNECRWETYNVIIQELISQGKKDYFEEIKYRLTDGENANMVILDIIDREKETVSGLIWLLKKRLEEYLSEDFNKRFYV